MQTVVETPTYLRDAERLFSAEQRADIVSILAVNPLCGDVMPGTGGYRKLRVGREGIGKRGGARIVYIQRNEEFPVFLIAAFAKNEKDNLSKAERNAMAKVADRLFSEYGGKQ